MKRWLIVLAVSLGLLAPAAAFWQSRDSNYNISTSSGTSPATQTFETFATENAGTATATFNATGLGATSSNRVIGIIAMARSNANSNSVTGITLNATNNALHCTGSLASPLGLMASDIWYFADAGALGTSTNIVVTWTGTNTRSGIYVYNITTTTPTPANCAETSGVTTFTSLSQSITVPANGVGIAGVASQQTGNTQSFTNATLDSSNALSGGQSTAGGHTTSTGSVSVTGNSTGTANTMVLSLAAWGP